MDEITASWLLLGGLIVLFVIILLVHLGVI